MFGKIKLSTKWMSFFLQSWFPDYMTVRLQFHDFMNRWLVAHKQYDLSISTVLHYALALFPHWWRAKHFNKSLFPNFILMNSQVIDIYIPQS